jgi:hypothetical protein
MSRLLGSVEKPPGFSRDLPVEHFAYFGMEAVADVTPMAAPGGQNLARFFGGLRLDAPLLHAGHMNVRVE